MEISLANAALIPVVLALVQVAKKLGIPSKWAPVVSIVLGFITVYLTNGHNSEILAGLLVGLSASGIWSGSKSMIASSAVPEKITKISETLYKHLV